MGRINVARRLVALAAAVAGLCAASWAAPAALAAEASPPAPGNDSRSAAQVIHALPATLGGTLVGATTELLETPSACGGPSEHTVWYSFRAGEKQRLAINLAAAGALDAAGDVFHAKRSELESVVCRRTDAHGEASLTFNASKNGLYLIRVAALQASSLDKFTLELFLPTPAVQPPGPRLPAAGASGRVDRIQNINAAYSVALHSGTSYIVSLAGDTPRACVSGELFAPGTTSFEDGSPVEHLNCGGFRLFTPGPGQGGLYSMQVTPDSEYRGIQRFHLQVAPAGRGETAPGIALGNYGHAHAHLSGNSAQVLRLYRVDIHSDSNLTLRLLDPSSARFNLQLRSSGGRVIECQCGSSGPQTLTHQLKPGRYYAVVSTRGASAGNFTLVRQSRTITSMHVSFSPASASAGQDTPIEVQVSPAVSGPVTVDVERFDPVFGWQFYRQESGFASDGVATLPFAAPAIGRWRVSGRYEGSRTASPSAARGFAYLLVS
jgi:hypothetical protein